MNFNAEEWYKGVRNKCLSSGFGNITDEAISFVIVESQRLRVQLCPDKVSVDRCELRALLEEIMSLKSNTEEAYKRACAMADKYLGVTK